MSCVWPSLCAKHNVSPQISEGEREVKRRRKRAIERESERLELTCKCCLTCVFRSNLQLSTNPNGWYHDFVCVCVWTDAPKSFTWCNQLPKSARKYLCANGLSKYLRFGSMVIVILLTTKIQLSTISARRAPFADDQCAWKSFRIIGPSIFGIAALHSQLEHFFYVKLVVLANKPFSRSKQRPKRKILKYKNSNWTINRGSVHVSLRALRSDRSRSITPARSSSRSSACDWWRAASERLHGIGCWSTVRNRANCTDAIENSGTISCPKCLGCGR